MTAFGRCRTDNRQLTTDNRRELTERVTRAFTAAIQE
jgi:hypothetical protein